MEYIVANVENVKFDIEVALEEQYGALPLPFSGMDKSIAAVCEFYPRGNCSKSSACPFRHVRGDRTIVCKHWLRGLCKKGDQCEFLHEYDMSKMPECYFYSRFSKWKHCFHSKTIILTFVCRFISPQTTQNHREGCTPVSYKLETALYGTSASLPLYILWTPDLIVFLDI
ncbi:unnamed protein product [Timema podura]|uniref:C3H1-type domain-containing protein n=1 Tax=Timema podura TaxID=61482 RepID=A0ABN7P3F2_TIMPD|nr:unnamed protein product [Timema podura]